MVTLSLTLAWSNGLSADGPGSGTPPTASSQAVTNSTKTQIFQVRGVVIQVQPGGKELEIRHEAIPDYMPAMTMPFEVRDTNETRGLVAGDSVSFRLHVTDVDGWIDQVRKTGSTPTNSPATAGFRAVRDVEPLQVGDVLPEFRFTNQLGQTISTSQFKGQALGINFLFTRCPFPTFCPRLANNFADVQRKLTQIEQGPTNWHLLTITFDPAFDTPAVLKTYAQGYGYDPARWTFATGDLEDITALADHFGQTFWQDESKGRVGRIFSGNDWNSAQFAAEMVQGAK
jgi:protein SCO1/2